MDSQSSVAASGKFAIGVVGGGEEDGGEMGLRRSPRSPFKGKAPVVPWEESNKSSGLLLHRILGGWRRGFEAVKGGEANS